MPARQWPHVLWAVLSMHLLLLLYSLTAAPAAHAQFSLAPRDVASLKAIQSWLHDIIDPSSSFPIAFFSTWNFDSDPCSFEGVLCDVDASGHTRVAALNLGIASGSSAGLRGRLHPSLGSLSALVQLTLAPGKVGGPIPSTLSQLPCLQNLGLSHNLLTGNIPAGLASIPRLTTLDLAFNRLSGTIPPPLAELPCLVTLRLAHNRLVGTLPASFIKCPLLEHIDASRNSLIGALPWLPPSVTYISLGRNRLSGGLQGLEELQRLSYLDLSRNQLVGSVPAALMAAPLSVLSLQHNALSGTLSPTQLVIIPTVDLSFNQLSGPLSPFFAFTRNLYLNNNRLTGAVPQEFVDQLLSASMHTLYLQHNFLTNFPRLPAGSSVPLTASVCVQYNCMQLPPLDSPCPHMRPSRPSTQCKAT